MKIVFATNNHNKLAELQNLLSGYKVQLLSLNDFPFIKDIKETGSTFQENTLIKAKTVYKKVNLPVLADDSGLEVEYLNNRPGVYSKRYAATDEGRIKKLLKELKDAPLFKRKARFICSMILKDKNRPFMVTGFCNGIISEKPAGKNGFGYDPVFFLPDIKKTMAQLSMEEKNTFSHRGNALKQIKEILINYYKLKKI